MYVLITGAGMIGGGLARKLLENKHDVVVVDQNKDLCDKLYSETGVIAVNGSGARIEILKEAGIEKADVVVAATGSDADNLACAILAKSFNVPQVIVRMRNPEYENAYHLAGVDTVVHVTDIMVNRIIMEIEKPDARRLTSIGGGRAEIFMVIVPRNAKVAGKTVKDITENPRFPPQCIFVAVFNREKEEFAIPRGAQVINGGDELFMISSAEDMKRAADILTETAGPKT